MKKILVILLILVPLCGCLNNNSTSYTGESKNWSARYSIDNPKGEYHNNTLKITYKGENPKEVSVIKFKYEGPNISGSGEQKLSGSDSVVSKSEGNGTLPLEDSKINVTIEWNGKNEELILSTPSK
ncbi:hypothetical protein D3P08_12325 [Paenibacillus nanensis]|uniref:Lipoprotein n=1 Tax=Paenibacillus nanensis TaxID=393251 RepID=A0A3A1V2K0_9BACL|nr:hypothetical protein [Paenibacillus nanensis]RIX52783.1 hypothetical protein D3P08_12325 [Paenibacillus nanensis]